MKKIDIKIRDNSFSGEITDADGIVFLSVLFNDEEIKSLESGKSQQAIDTFKKRYVDRVEKTLAQANTDKERALVEQRLNEEIAQVIYHRIQRHPVTRSTIAARICECFPDIPDSLVYWKSESRFGIRLNSAETMDLFMKIIGTVLVEVVNNEDKSKSYKQSPVLTAKPKKVSSTAIAG